MLLSFSAPRTHASPSPPSCSRFACSIMGMSTNGTPPTQDSIERTTTQLAEMEKFATSPGCRRRAVLSHFGEDMGETRRFCQECKNEPLFCSWFVSPPVFVVCRITTKQYNSVFSCFRSVRVEVRWSRMLKVAAVALPVLVCRLSRNFESSY